MYQGNNLNVIKNDKDEQLVKQKVNPIISQIGDVNVNQPRT